MPLVPRSLAQLREEHCGLSLLLAVSASGCLGLPRISEETDDADAEGGDTGHADDTGAPTTSTTSATSPPIPPPSTSTTSATTSTTTPPMPPPPGIPDVLPIPDGGTTGVCTGYAELIADCYGGQYIDEAYGYCLEYLTYVDEYTGGECVPPFEEYLVCLGTLSCEEFQMGIGPCDPQAQAFEDCLSQF